MQLVFQLFSQSCQERTEESNFTIINEYIRTFCIQHIASSSICYFSNGTEYIISANKLQEDKNRAHSKNLYTVVEVKTDTEALNHT